VTRRRLTVEPLGRLVERLEYSSRRLRRPSDKGCWCFLLGRRVEIACPRCGLIGTLIGGIDVHGVTDGPVPCPVVGCDFFDFLQLAGWSV